MFLVLSLIIMMFLYIRLERQIKILEYENEQLIERIKIFLSKETYKYI
jgi:hypothetical protein